MLDALSYLLYKKVLNKGIKCLILYNKPKINIFVKLTFNFIF